MSKKCSVNAETCPLRGPMRPQVRSIRRGCLIAAALFGGVGAYLLWSLGSPLLAPPLVWQSSPDLALYVFAKAQNEAARLGIRLAGFSLLAASGLFLACFESLR